MADLLSIGKSGLFASKSGLETTGHNLSNVNTEGFSRQKLNQTTNVPTLKNGLIQGTGVRLNGITRYNDAYIDKRLENSISEFNFHEEKSAQLEQVERIFNEIDSEGLNTILNKFYNSFRELANQPESETIRSVVRDSAKIVVKDFRRIRVNLNEITESIDNKLIQEVNDINSIINNVAKLNKTIASMEGAGDETSDLRDQRDLLVRNLSRSFNIHTYLDDRGQFNISAVGVGTLVAGANVQELLAARVGRDQSPYGSEGNVEIFFKERPTLKIGDKISGGKVTALLKTRNEEIAGFKKEVDDIAYEVAQTTNAVHRRGYVNRTMDIGIEGTPVQFDGKGKTTNINFFKEPEQRENASVNIDLSDEIKSDLSNIVTAINPNSPGDNRISLAISKLQHEKVFSEGTKTVEEQYLSSVGRVGVLSGKSKVDSEQAEGIWTQTKSLRDRLAGVSIDEETTHLMKYQHAYDASAKMLKVADEMFETVLNLKR